VNLTDAETQAISSRLQAFTPAGRRHHFAAAEAAATVSQKDLLRSLLAELAESHPEDVRLVRGYFNDIRIENERPIWAIQVSNAISLLGTLR
jgi:hypothetical protein